MKATQMSTGTTRVGAWTSTALRRFGAGPKRETPTSAIYFSSCMQGLIGQPGDETRPIWQMLPNAFLVHGQVSHLIILRQLDEKTMGLLAEHPAATLHYLIDDDVRAGSLDRNLPFGYRRRLLAMDKVYVPRVLSRADQLYVTSSRLLDVFASHAPKLVHPSFIMPVSALEHHSSNQGTFKLVFAGSRSHLKDLEHIAKPLKKFLKTHADVELAVFLGKYLKGFDLPNVTNLSPMSWPKYCEHLRHNSYHVGLMPLIDTEFNQARSISKLLDFAYLGAAPLNTRNACLAEFLPDEMMIDPHEKGAWFEALEKLYRDRLGTKAKAQANIERIAPLADAHAARQFWLKQLDLA